MITPVDIETLASSDSRKTPLSIFCEKQVVDFISSRAEAAIVTGWPGGEPQSRKETYALASSMRTKIKSMGVSDVIGRSVGEKVYLIRESAL